MYILADSIILHCIGQTSDCLKVVQILFSTYLLTYIWLLFEGHEKINAYLDKNFLKVMLEG